MPVLFKLRYAILIFLRIRLQKLLDPVILSEWKEERDALELQQLYYIHTQQTINIRPKKTWFTYIRNFYKYTILWFSYYIRKESSRLLDLQLAEDFEKYSPEEQDRIRDGDYYQ